ncbi:hypothetical protein KIN20_022955 [Parelaphostrongylus tenuis]|uniref:Uncharacterized protein n=1 Tax=Parelaphostrongylus tenuis TaxID=148309 RepID=A0AAD5QV42_PARTN|nr:hypothetical protein KIN20_022955 [Parelaphostrongylus tenuis]
MIAQRSGQSSQISRVVVSHVIVAKETSTMKKVFLVVIKILCHNNPVFGVGALFDTRAVANENHLNVDELLL